MGVSLSTARYLAPASFLYDFAAQQYGINSTPSMKDIHDRNLSFFSPQPYFIAGKFEQPQPIVRKPKSMLTDAFHSRLLLPATVLPTGMALQALEAGLQESQGEKRTGRDRTLRAILCFGQYLHWHVDVLLAV